MLLNLMSPVNQLGYGVVGWNILKGLYEKGHAVYFFPIGEPRWKDSSKFDEVVSNTRMAAKMFDPDSPCLRIWHQFDMAPMIGKGEKIGFPIFELDTFNEFEKHHLETLDRIFVASHWAKSVILENDINVPVDVIPFGVDGSLFYRSKEETRKNYWVKKKTVFINVGKWEKRKGHFDLCDAFSKAFEPGDDVELWMLNENPFIDYLNEEWKRKYLESPMGAHIRIIPRKKTQSEMREIFNQADCGVFPSRAEGWNLEILELMACGAHIIATNYSGHTEYLNSKNAMLIEPTGKEAAEDGIWFKGQGNWCTYNIDELVNHMREFHKKKQESGKRLENVAGIETSKKFTWNNTIEKLEEAL